MKKQEIEKIKELNQRAFLWLRKQSIKNMHSSFFVAASLEEYFAIIQEENRFLKIIQENYEKMDLDELSSFLRDFVYLAEETFEYYESCLQAKEGEMSKRDFAFLTETDAYALRLSGLLLTLEDVKAYLGYPEEFWHYIEPKISYRDHHQEAHHFFYLVNIKCDRDERVMDMHVGVPKIINLETALINIHEFRHAYDLYQLLGQTLPKQEQEYEVDAQEEEKNFVKKYVYQKLKDTKKKEE